MSDLTITLLKQYPIISDQIELDELLVILGTIEKIIDAQVAGDIVEFGCYVGTTSLFISRLLIAKNSDKKLYVYDSFDGLPEKTKEDESPLGIDFKRGELRSTKAQFIENYRKAGLPLPVICKKWFHQVEDTDMPSRISLAFLDGDYYCSIRASLALCKPRMSPGGVIIIDDYSNPALPGASRACRDTNTAVTQITHSLGICTL
jgi:O-methyltransferase